MSTAVLPKSTAETMLELQFAALATNDGDRAAAFARFAEAGLPSRRNESWHYTDLRAAMKTAEPLAAKPDAARIEVARRALGERLGDVRLVLLDGCYVAALSDPTPVGLRLGPLALGAPAPRADPLVWLNDAFAPTGLEIEVEGEIAERIEIAHFASAGEATAVYSRLGVSFAAGSKATLVETFAGAGQGLQRNAVLLLSVGAGARCDYVGAVDDAPGLHVESQIVSLGGDAEFKGFALVAGGGLVRRQVFARHAEPGARIALSGVTLLDGSRRADTTIEVIHAAPHGTSREFFRTIVDDEAQGTFQGKVIVAPKAQKTDGAMKSQAILLSPTSTMNNKPELEILADDVACGHGATVGALDADELFYLQSRGIPPEEARAMLLEAFAAEAIERIADERLAEAMREKARLWFRGRGVER